MWKLVGWLLVVHSFIDVILSLKLSCFKYPSIRQKKHSLEITSMMLHVAAGGFDTNRPQLRCGGAEIFIYVDKVSLSLLFMTNGLAIFAICPCGLFIKLNEDL
ncbi:hypothetical protein Droror1_Dr00008980 [Drosera rotundifolia]